MSNRRQSREIALQILFQCEFDKELDYEQSLKLFSENFHFHSDSIEYSKILLDGVIKNKTQIDQYINNHCKNWHLDRLALVDKNILRIACFEMKHLLLAPKIVINEAIELATKYGNAQSGSFINGILDQFAKSEKLII